MLRLWLALVTAKIAYFFSRLLGRQGTTISGVVALRIYPLILKRLSQKLKTVVFVTGTNGKTTTSNLLASMLKQSGRSVIHNREGANMLTGITASVVKEANWRGTLNGDCAVFEVDEGSLPAVMKQLAPSHIVIINFFRDQLDRYGEIDVLIQNMMAAIRPAQTRLILNTDDPLVGQFEGLNKHTIYFGMRSETENSVFGQFALGESIFCPQCGEEMKYRHIHFGQLGDYACSCGFSRRTPKYEAGSIQARPTLSFQMNGLPLTSALIGSFNAYNVLAAAAAALECGVSMEHVQQALTRYAPQNGRMETFIHRGLPYILNLNKNPSGTNVIINEIMADPARKQLLIILNDFVADGEDISWIWDVDFEVFNQKAVEKIVCAGSRSSELALRLKYAGIDSNKIKDISRIHNAINYILEHPLQTYVLPTYSALEITKHDLGEKVQPT
ncbi:MurT ligase domain-containing protein [Ferviditalea candida]|uniref:Lipid II isoglutaminyl synthase (glutamine-hydrolyzing) subunit MurT n=1 Tax=Ferviditalea candida TaxID=3108399 RepID=A0ABU5ZLW3_9BACL|nr:MurT ligase domain-containing protein [Paenibacillaceae bacterium T2]